MIPMSKSDIKYLVGSEEIVCRPLPIFSDIAIKFLDDLSKELRNDTEARKFPDVMTFAFWCRKANIVKLKEEYAIKFPRIGKGIAFHIAPSNVPINFVFSYAFGVLAGNGNVVRVSEKDFRQIKIVCRILNKLFENQEYKTIAEQTQIVSYGHDKDINDYYSDICSTRIIWGGDNTINEIRQSPIGTRTTEITFADRFSFAIFDENTINDMSEDDLRQLSEKFYNDTYLMDQNACSSPHFILWKTSPSKQGRKKFWNAVYQAAQKYELPEKKVLDKYTILCEKATELDEIVSVERYNNLLYVVELDKLPDSMDELRGKFGLFYEGNLEDIHELCKKITTKMQTCVTYGIDDQKLAEILIENHVMGIDRIVPVGKAMDIGIYWDGYDVIGSMSRQIVTVY